MTHTIEPGENPAETMRKVIERLGQPFHLDLRQQDPFAVPVLISTPEKRRTENVTAQMIEALEFMHPLRRRGTARLQSLESLIDWTNRFKDDDSALFADGDLETPSLTAIADYNPAGPVNLDPRADAPTARHGQHRATYNFPLSDEWKLWTGVSGKALDKNEMGEFIEANAKDVLDPTPAILAGKLDGAEKWEQRLIETAQKIDGRFGQLAQLVQMSKHFQIYENSNLEARTNRDTGEQELQFVNEHRAKDGAPLRVPNLIIITIPVFRNGALYRMPVRFRYRKSGSSIAFILSIYAPEKAFKDAFEEACNTASEGTGLPLFMGIPE